jgi:hypothetical protein
MNQGASRAQAVGPRVDRGVRPRVGSGTVAGRLTPLNTTTAEATGSCMGVAYVARANEPLASWRSRSKPKGFRGCGAHPKVPRTPKDVSAAEQRRVEEPQGSLKRGALNSMAQAEATKHLAALPKRGMCPATSPERADRAAMPKRGPCPRRRVSRGLTFEVRRDRRWDARPDGRIIDNTGRRAWWPAVGPRLDRGVRPQLGKSASGKVRCAPQRSSACRTRRGW